ncbi:HalX domain-containing protein [Halorussus sp. MSC15.2]|uniref:HalX domain-containing protein n=1 Tax=Halorussus sp. MSC15.2 TaxID=2283638 RepID=UPI0013D4F4EF|nr:response regulator [Halorussus sp. MSC15.2]NEU57515.1 response regulator [Halorussus sp. MSC15.2]
MGGRESRPTVLLVDADPTLRALYDEWCSEVGTVSAVADAEAALATVGEEFDAVLTERRLPDATGRELVARLADENRFTGFVTSATPTVDLADVPVDVYLRKPVSRDQFRATIDRFAALSSADPAVRTCAALAEKYRVLRAVTSAEERRSNEAFARFVARYESLRRRHASEMADLPSPTADPTSISNSSA